MATPAPETFAHLLETAINEPGLISSAYSAFHSYSLGNQLLALSQCMARGITPGPIATYQRWKELGRYVRKGEKALTLCRPVTVKRATPAGEEDERTVATFFVYKPLWFVLAQTEGQPMAEPLMAHWEAARALQTLDVTEIPFDSMNGNVMGFARGRSIAINPVNPMPHKTRFHELAHVLLGHTGDGIMNDGEQMPRNLRECEAESVALLCCAALNLPGVKFSRGYIQAYWGTGNPIPERSAQRILKAANQILVAGRPANANVEAQS
jgi:hypothetical protein